MTGFRFSFWKPCENRHLSHNILITFAADVQRSVLHIAFQARRSLSCFIIIHCSATRCDRTTPRAAQARPLATRLHRRRLSLLHPYYIRKDGTTPSTAALTKSTPIAVPSTAAPSASVTKAASMLTASPRTPAPSPSAAPSSPS